MRYKEKKKLLHDLVSLRVDVFNHPFNYEDKAEYSFLEAIEHVAKGLTTKVTQYESEKQERKDRL